MRLLLVGGNAFYQDIKKYAIRNGVYLIGIGLNEHSNIAEISDEFFVIDTRDVDSIVKLVLEKGVTGLFAGASEQNIKIVMQVADRTGLRYFCNEKQWNILADKGGFKAYAESFGLKTVPSYDVVNIREKIGSGNIFPLVIKPVDSSGARGVNIAYNENEYNTFLDEALRFSNSKKVVVEKFIDNSQELFVKYLVQDGTFMMISMFTKHTVHSNTNYLGLPILHVYPSKYINDFRNKCEKKIIDMLTSLNLKNGLVILQAFHDNGEYYFIEAGLRLGGSQDYIFTEFMNGYNYFDLMLNYSLTGRLSETNIFELCNPHFIYPACNYYVSLTKGTVSEISGLDDVKEMKQVLNITQMLEPGDVVVDDNSLERVALRIHVWDQNKEKLADTLVKISKLIRVFDVEGKNMQLEPLTYTRVYNRLINS